MATDWSQQPINSQQETEALHPTTHMKLDPTQNHTRFEVDPFPVESSGKMAALTDTVTAPWK